MTSTKQILLRKHTRREFRARMDSGELQACILPVAAIEQHLEHLEMEHDWRSVTLIAGRVATNLIPAVLVADALMAGVSEHHMTHKGTLTLQPGTFLSVLSDLIDSLVRAGFKNILVLNGHGGNAAPCRTSWDQFLRRFQINLHFLSYWDTLTENDARECLSGGHRLPDDLPGHAQEFETAIAMAAFPENLRPNALADQPDPGPSYATPEKGKVLIDRVVRHLTRYLEEMIRGKRVHPVPSFHP